jgi:glucokinase
MILAGDIGGTKTNLAFFNDALETVASQSYPSRDHAGLGEILDRFLADSKLHPQQAAFGVAGPVRDGRCKATNLPWIVDSAELAQQLHLAQVGLINDLEANAFGISALQPHDFAALNVGVPDPQGNAAVISAGTGLGEAGLYRLGNTLLPFACEGGHSGFTPRNELEMELLRHLFTLYDYPDVEHVLSGPGLHNIYNFLRDTGRGTEPPWMTEEMKHHDPSAAISHAAMEGQCPMAVDAMRMFVAIYGTEAANLALKIMATGGVFVGGGIAPKILPMLQDDWFMRSFRTTGVLRRVLENIPVRVILNEKTALLGAACYARDEKDKKN